MQISRRVKMAEWAGAVIIFERCVISAQFLACVHYIEESKEELKFRDSDRATMVKLIDISDAEFDMFCKVINRLRLLHIPDSSEQPADGANFIESVGKVAMPRWVWQTAKIATVDDAKGGKTPVTFSFTDGRVKHVLAPGDPQACLAAAARLLAGSTARVFSYEKFMELTAPKK